MIRDLIAKFNKSMAERVASVRYKREVPIKLSITPTGKTGELKVAPTVLYIKGETKDVSRSGISFVVPSIRIKENYLVGEGKLLNAELDLPNGKVAMRIVGCRYERVGEQVSTARYLVGASIAQMSDENREAYEDFLRLGNQTGNTGRLKFGVGQN